MKKFSFSSILTNFKLLYRLTAILILVFGVFYINFSFNQHKKLIENKLENSSGQVSKILSYDIDYIKYQLFYAAKQIASTNGDKKQTEKLLTTFVTNVNSQVDVALTWNAFSWIDANDKLTVDGTAGILLQPIDMKDRDYLEYTRQNADKIIFGKPVYGALSQRLIIPAGVGVFSARGAYLGTLVFGFDAEKILTKLEKAISNEAIGFALLREKNYMFGSENLRKESLDEITITLANIKDEDAANKTVISSQEFSNKKNSTLYFQKLKNYPISVVSFYDKDTYYQEVLNIFLKQLLFVATLILACVILFHQINKRIVKPISRLSDFAKKLLDKDFAAELEKPDSKDLYSLYSAMILLRDSFKREEELINKLQIANQKIAQENFNKSEFLSAISHDIRNPLAAIISFSQFIRDKNQEKINYDEFARDIELCALDALQFINDLMDVAQTASGDFSINMENKVDIAEIISRSIRINRDFAYKRKISITSEIDHNLETINLDQRRMKQILVNLISNSVKYSSEGTKIMVNAQIISKNKKRQLQIIIKDQGYGMTQSEIEKALTKFGRIQNEKHKHIDSFGLGLPLVKQMVELQMGELKINSQKGVGTEVVLTFNY